MGAGRVKVALHSGPDIRQDWMGVVRPEDKDAQEWGGGIWLDLFAIVWDYFYKSPYQLELSKREGAK